MGRSALAGLIALLVFLATLAPGVTSEDSGELAAAAALWGVPHPPGFPLWVLLARAAVAVSPAPAVVAVGVASAVFGAALVFVLAELSRSLGASPEAAGVGALLVGLGQTFWSQAIIVEVYTLNALLLGLTLLFVVRWGKEAQDKYLFAAALCWGLGLANHHPLTLLTGPGFAIYVLLRGGSQILQPGRFLRVIGFAVAPLALYLYLPVAAHFAPPINWGQPDSLAALWAHISRSSYSSLELSETVSWADKKSFLLHFVGLWSEEFTLWILVPGLALGIFALRQRHPKELILLLVVMVFNSLVLLAILRFRFTHENVMRVNE